jgi:hypothetical protein
MFCCPCCSHLSTILNNVVEPESGVAILFNIVDNCEQCGQQNIVQSCFHQYCINLSVLTHVEQLWYSFPNYVYPNPPCQLFLWEETVAPGENPQLSAERWLTLFTWVHSKNRTHNLRDEGHLLWRLHHRSRLCYRSPWSCDQLTNLVNLQN